MRAISLDSSFIISLALNCMLNIFDILSERVDFIIGRKVYIETVDRALNSKRHRFQAIRILKRIKEGKIRLIEIPERKIQKVMNIANNIFFSNRKNIEIVHVGETEAVIIAREYEVPLLGIDEKTMRLLIEDPYRLREIIESRTHRPIEIDEDNLGRWSKMVKGVKVIRSADLFVYVVRKDYLQNYPLKEKMLEGGLWSLKFSGCAISDEEIREYLKWVKKLWKRKK